MDFNDTPEEARFRSTARAWLESNAAWLDENTPRNIVGGDFGGPTGLEKCKAWQAKKAAAGYACITWPKAWGGPGGSPIHSVIFHQEEAKFPHPGYPFNIGLDMCLPALMTFADAETRERFAGPAMRGEQIWCQLFSEPSGGSDVAAVRTRAVQAEDGSGDWIINGQKVWTTGAHYSDYGLLICRTDPNVPKHKGLTMFWIDMKDPAVTRKPIHQMNSGAEFNEVFFTDLRVKDGQRVGGVNDGWKVSIVTLMNERVSVGGIGGLGWAQFLETARTTPSLGGKPALNDQALREKIADWYVYAEGLKHTRNRTITALSRGATPGPESSIGKLVIAALMQDVGNAAIEMLDQYGLVNQRDLAPLDGGFHGALLYAPGLRIASGTDEILKNIIGERVLGLPGDIRVDKDVPFKDVPGNR